MQQQKQRINRALGEKSLHLHASLTFDDDDRRSNDAGDGVCGDTLVYALVFGLKPHNRQVSSTDKSPCT